MLPILAKLESALIKDCRQKALESLKSFQTKLLEEQLNRNFSDCMIIYYTEAIRQCNLVLSPDNTWPGHSPHLDGGKPMAIK